MLSLRSAGVVVVALGAAILFFLSRDGGPDVPEGIVYGNGRIEAAEVDVATKLAGRIASIDAREGDLVKAGQLLARIDSAQLDAQRLRAEADVARAQSMVAQADAQIAQAAAQLKLAERELERASDLLKRGHTSEETYDTRLSNRDVAMANLTSAKANRVSQLRSVEFGEGGSGGDRDPDCGLQAGGADVRARALPAGGTGRGADARRQSDNAG